MFIQPIFIFRTVIEMNMSNVAGVQCISGYSNYRCQSCSGGSKQLDRDLKIAAYIVLATAPGVAVLAWCISLVSAPWLYPLLGVAALVAFVGLGLLVAANVAGREGASNDLSGANRTKAL